MSERNTFPDYEESRAVSGPANVAPRYGQLIEELRTLQDLAVSTALTAAITDEAVDRVEALNDLLRPLQVPPAQSPAGKVATLPGRGSLLHIPWTIETFDANGVSGRGRFCRFHHGSNGAVHGGSIPMLFDDLIGLISQARGRPYSRTAFLHVNYRMITPLDTELIVEGSVDGVEGRKTFISSVLKDTNGAVLADCQALMVELLEGQP